MVNLDKKKTELDASRSLMEVNYSRENSIFPIREL